VTRDRWGYRRTLLLDEGLVVAACSTPADAERLAEILNDHDVLVGRVGALRSELAALKDRRRTP